MSLHLIAAIARDGAIGQGGGLPWGRLAADMTWFHALTTADDPTDLAAHIIGMGVQMESNAPVRNGLIMGRRTYESLPGPLAGREVILLGQRKHLPARALVSTWHAESFNEALDCALKIIQPIPPHIFACGGAQVYAEALRHPALETLFLTEIDAEYPEADTWWPLPLEQRAWEAGAAGQLPAAMRAGERLWRRTAVSAWITEPDRPRYRCGIWQRGDGV